MNQSAMLARFVREADVDCVLLAGRYTLLDESALDDLLPLCEATGVEVIAAGVFNSGLLADPRPGAHFDYAPASPELVERARRLAAICAPLRDVRLDRSPLGGRAADERRRRGPAAPAGALGRPNRLREQPANLQRGVARKHRTLKVRYRLVTTRSR